MTEILRRGSIYLWYYFSVQFEQIFWYWVLGMKHFVFYLAFAVLFALASGFVVNCIWN